MYKHRGDPVVTVRLSAPMIAAAKMYAREQGVSLSAVIRDKLGELLDAQGVPWRGERPLPGQTRIDA